MRIGIDEYRNEIIHEDDQLNSPISPLKRKNCMLEEKETGHLKSPKKGPDTFLRLETVMEQPAPGHGKKPVYMDRKKQAVHNNDVFDSTYGRNFKPKGPFGNFRDPGSVAPFLKQDSLGFFGSHVSLSIEDKARVL